MATVVSLESLGKGLMDLLERLPAGESVTVVRADGKPVARLTAVKPEHDGLTPDGDLLAEWEELAKEVSKAWKSEKSALEILAEMRR